MDIYEDFVSANNENMQREMQHDMRHFLGNIDALSDILIESVEQPGNHETAQIAEMIKTLSQEALHLFLNTIYVTQVKEKTEKTSIIDVYTILRNKCNWLYKKTAQKKHIRLNIVIPETPSMIRMEEIDFSRIMDNLISNAIKFTSKNGEINLKAETLNKQIIITVSDTGIGIPKQLTNQIFMPLPEVRRRGTDNETSTGIGLAVVRKIVTSNGGKIWFESEENKGTSFYISFPIF